MKGKWICWAGLACLLLPATAAAQDEPASFKDVCSFIAYHEGQNTWTTVPPRTFDSPVSRNEFLAGYFVRYGFFDLDGDGIPERVKPEEFTGTMGGDSYDYTLSSAPPPGSPAARDQYTDPNLPPAIAKRFDEDGPLGFGQAWLPYKGRFYSVDFSDEGGAFVLDASYFKKGGALRYACVFDNEVKETDWQIDPGSKPFQDDAKAICPDGGNNHPLPAKPIEAAERLSESDGMKIGPFPMRGGEIGPACAQHDGPCKDIWHVDFDNDGVVERLLKMSGDSGAGRGCDVEYFVLLTPTNEIAKGPKADLLLKLQQVDQTDAYPVRPCQMTFDWVKIAGRTVLERVPEQSPDRKGPWDTMTLVHDLYMARRGDAARLCYADFTVTPKTVYDAAPN